MDGPVNPPPSTDGIRGPSPSRTSLAAAGPASTLPDLSTPGHIPQRGRDGYWKLGQASTFSPAVSTSEQLMDTDLPATPLETPVAVPLPTPSIVKDGREGRDGLVTPSTAGSGAKIVLRVGGGGGLRDGPDSRASSPSSTTGRKRRADPIPGVRHSPRSRISPPSVSMPPSGLSAEASPAPSQTPLASSTDDRGAVPLSIFAPPPPSEALPEALQEVIGPRPAADGDVLMRDAAEGFESRLRPTRGRDVGVRTGVSASGKGVKVGGAIKLGTTQGKKKRTRGEPEVPNQDFCSACRGIGRFLCCDGCPRSFHFMCLEPPLRIDELPDEEVWYCKKCRQERVRKESSTASPSKDKDLKPIPAVFKQLSKKIDSDNPTQFRLPTEIRQYFVGVGTGSRGEYVDTEETRTKYDRKGFQEERDGTRLRDGKARPVACYACGGSSIPLRSLTTDPEASWRQIVSCDHCALHWHLDCLNPPLASMPNSGRKWMCPNHAEQVMPRRRTVRSGLETVDVEDRGAANNGNIVVVPDEEPRPRLAYEDMVINKRKYRVPERIIRLDFWDKIGLGKGKAKAPGVNGNSGGRRLSGDSEVTSLGLEVAEASQEEIAAAELMLSLFNGPAALPLPIAGTPTSDKLASAIKTEGGGPEGSAVGSSGSEIGGVGPGAGAGAGAATGTPKIMLRMTRQNGL